MVLKEAYAYQNFLQGIISRATALLYDRSFMTTTTERHLKSKSNPDAKDEEIIIAKTYTECTPTAVINALMKAYEERCALAGAIADAKNKADMNIDVAMECNKLRHSLIAKFTLVDQNKPSETKSRASDYRINATSGSQEAYYYDVEKVTTIDFDRKDVRGIIKKLQKEATDVSTKKDYVEITTTVDYDPIWDINDSFEEIAASL